MKSMSSNKPSDGACFFRTSLQPVLVVNLSWRPRQWTGRVQSFTFFLYRFRMDRWWLLDPMFQPTGMGALSGTDLRKPKDWAGRPRFD